MDQVAVRTHGSYRTTVTARQHTFHADVPAASGGDDSAATPEELLLGALGSCMAETALMYARRKDFPLDDVEIALEMERFSGADYADYDGDATFVHEIRERITLHGDLSDAQRDRIIEIAHKCPVRRAITHPLIFKEEVVVVTPNPM
jgi:putative redox protein